MEEAFKFISEAMRMDPLEPNIEKSFCIIVDKLQDNATAAYGTGVTFLPSVFGRPHLVAVHAPGWQPVVQAAHPGPWPAHHR